MTEVEDNLRLSKKQSKRNVQINRSVRKISRDENLGVDTDFDEEASYSGMGEKSNKNSKLTSYKKSKKGKESQNLLLHPRETLVIIKFYVFF